MMGPAYRGGRERASRRTIEVMLPANHLLRRIDRCLDTSELRQALAGHYSARGRPSIDPELLIRMILVGRIYAITSERRLCEELRYNLAYRWFCRLAPTDKVPHALVPRSCVVDSNTVRTFDLPVPTPELTISAMWHPRFHADPGHRWLRQMVISTCGTLA